MYNDTVILFSLALPLAYRLIFPPIRIDRSETGGHLVYDHFGVLNPHETEWVFLILLLN